MDVAAVRRYEFSLPPDTSADDVAATVAEFGLAVVDGYLAPAIVDGLVAEAHALFADDAPWVHPEAYSIGSSVRMERADIDRSAYAHLADVFATRFLEAIGHQHFGDGYLLSRTVYVILDKVGSSTPVQQAVAIWSRAEAWIWSHSVGTHRNRAYRVEGLSPERYV